jgi:hypothetical protein
MFFQQKQLMQIVAMLGLYTVMAFVDDSRIDFFLSSVFSILNRQLGFLPSHSTFFFWIFSAFHGAPSFAA